MLALFESPPELPPGWTNPLHAYLTIIVGTLTIFFVGLSVSLLGPKPRSRADDGG
jgi:hypothetical protein